jgi:hypothetical protein
VLLAGSLFVVAAPSAEAASSQQPYQDHQHGCFDFRGSGPNPTLYYICRDSNTVFHFVETPNGLTVTTSNGFTHQTTTIVALGRNTDLHVGDVGEASYTSHQVQVIRPGDTVQVRSSMYRSSSSLNGVEDYCFTSQYHYVHGQVLFDRWVEGC